MDDVQLWSGALTALQIVEVMNQNNGDGITPSLPSAPLGLRVTTTTNGRVNLRWTPVSVAPSVTDYQIEYKFTTG